MPTDTELERLSRLLEGDLPPEETARLQRELTRRADLREALATLQRLEVGIADLVAEPLSQEEARELVQGALRRARPIPLPARRPRRWMQVTPALVACLVGGFLLGSTGPRLRGISRDATPLSLVVSPSADHGRQMSREQCLDELGRLRKENDRLRPKATSPASP